MHFLAQNFQCIILTGPKNPFLECLRLAFKSKFNFHKRYFFGLNKLYCYAMHWEESLFWHQSYSVDKKLIYFDQHCNHILCESILFYLIFSDNSRLRIGPPEKHEAVAFLAKQVSHHSSVCFQPTFPTPAIRQPPVTWGSPGRSSPRSWTSCGTGSARLRTRIPGWIRVYFRLEFWWLLEYLELHGTGVVDHGREVGVDVECGALATKCFSHEFLRSDHTHSFLRGKNTQSF